MTCRSALGALLGLGLAVACGGGQRAPDLGPSILVASPPPRAAYVSPAVYRYHPRIAAPLTARRALEDGRVLFVGQRGERWLVDVARRTAEAAPELAPEELVAVTPRSPSGWVFLGRSGAGYEAGAPLAPFDRSTTPEEPLARVRASGALLVGVGKDGTLVRSETSGTSWAKVGPEDVHFADVAMMVDGKGLALAVPEALYESRDAGRTWQKGPATAFGVESFTEDDGSGIGLVTALGSRAYAPGAADPFPVAPAPARGTAHTLGVPLPLGPLGSAARAGRGVLVGDEWLELRSDEPGGVRLLRGRLGQPLTAAPFGPAKGCSDVRLAGWGPFLYLVCARQRPSGATTPLEIRRSTDAGKTWAREPYAVDGSLSELTLAVGADGALLASGVCPRTSAGPGCRPSGIHRRMVTEGDAGPRTALEPVAVPSLAGSALALVYSTDGRTAYAVGRRTKGDALTVFVSRGDPRSFDAHPVDALRTTEDDDRGYGRTAEIVVESTAATEDGMVGFAVNRRGHRLALVVDDSGRLVALAKPPVDAALLGVAGGRIFALDPASRDAWESLDAGSTFDGVGKIPAEPCPGARECSIDVACFESGCVIADALTRVGWGKGPRSVLLPRQEDTKGKAARRIATPFTCTLDGADFRRVSNALGPPSADQAAIGKKSWFVATYDPRSGAASVVSSPPGKTLTVEETPLLRAVQNPAQTAVTVSVQVEGVAALRYTLPRTADVPIASVEVAFSDLLGGRTARGVIPSGGASRPEDVAAGRSGTILARPALLSIASGGIYVRLHAALGDRQPTYFLDGRSVETLDPVKWPDVVGQRGRTEMVHVGRAHVPLRLDSALVIRGAGGNGSTFDALTAGYPKPADFGLFQQTGVAYVGRDAGLYVASWDASGKRRRAFVAPFRAEGAPLAAPVAVPMQADLGETPRPCTATDRARTPRVVASFQVGTRHPVIINDPVEPLRVLLTEDAVLHGTPAEPCVAVFDAGLVVSEAATRGADERALVFPDAPERGFLFRPASPSGFEVRTMTCHLDPAADIPAEVFRREGTLEMP